MALNRAERVMLGNIADITVAIGQVASVVGHLTMHIQNQQQKMELIGKLQNAAALIEKVLGDASAVSQED